MMLTRFLPGLACLCLLSLTSQAQAPLYFNRAPLKQDVLVQLPLGSIKAKGWLLNQLENQRDGATGHAEELYPGKDDLGPDADWLGGNGRSWEKAPYYLKGLVALAFTLDDTTLRNRAKKWIDYTLDHQQASGLFGPPAMKDWWPRMPFLYALQSWFEATNDPRVVPFLSKYFGYELANLDADPLRDWGRSRAGDNIELVLWLYNRTGEESLLQLAAKLKQQAYPWGSIFTNNEFFNYGRDFHTKHMVSVAQALKFPAVYAQVEPGGIYDQAMQRGIAHIMHDHGLPQGLSSGTEMLAGNSSIQGVETCTVVEWMQSLETGFRTLQDASLGDQLEKVAFNALPAQFTRDFKGHSYYTLPNQVQAVRGGHGFNQDYGNGIVPGPYSGYPCCRYNMHMGWPYFVKNSWAATPDSGLAVNTFGPMELSYRLNGNMIRIDEQTDYPFEEQIRLNIRLDHAAMFPLHLRIPAWCKTPVVTVNGKRIQDVKPGAFLRIDRSWKSGDKVVLNFPMELRVCPQVNRGVSIERGPMVYALKIDEKYSTVNEAVVPGFRETEIIPGSPWNYGLMLNDSPLEKQVRVLKQQMPLNPFVQGSTPVMLRVKARRIPSWTIDQHKTSASDVPFGPVSSTEPVEEITLVPFGSESLRLSIFPRIGTPAAPPTSISEDFGSGLPDGFVAYGGGWYTHNGSLLTAANEDGRSGDSGPKFIATGTDFGDLQFSAEVNIRSSGDGGLLFRVSDPAIGPDAYNGYYLGLNAEAGVIQLGKSSKGKWQVLASAKYDLAIGTKYKVRLTAMGSHLEVFIDDAKKALLATDDDEFKRGNIGLRSCNGLMTVDHLEVRSVN